MLYIFLEMQLGYGLGGRRGVKQLPEQLVDKVSWQLYLLCVLCSADKSVPIFGLYFTKLVPILPK